jgi:hypothetical protein
MMMLDDAHLRENKSGRGQDSTLYVIFFRCSLLLVTIKGICKDDLLGILYFYIDKI